MVRAGHLGVKSGKGFFAYDKEGNKIVTKKNGTITTEEIETPV